MKVIIQNNRTGSLGSLSEQEYMDYVKTLVDVVKGLYSLREYIKTQDEINALSKPIGFQDDLIDALDEFRNNFYKDKMSKIYRQLTALQVPSGSLDTVRIIQTLEMLCTHGVLNKGADIKFLDLIEPHLDDWEEFSSSELTILKYLYESILSVLNFYVLDTFFGDIKIQDGETVVKLDKSVNDYLQLNSLTAEEVMKDLKTIYDHFRPSLDVLTANPAKSLQFIKAVGDDELIDKVFLYKGLLTMEDVDLVISGALTVNDDFISMLENRHEKEV